MADGDATSEYERILAENARYTEAFDGSKLEAAPLSGLAIITCMDARISVEQALGLRIGDAHVIRNAGGLATDDAIRSLIVSQELLGTDEVIVIGHTYCGLAGIDDDAIATRLASRTGRRLDLALGGFADVEDAILASVERLRTHPWIRRVPVHGLLFDVRTGRLTEIA
ncbi:MAG TPA: carbonic anhydrase [Candidatus Limnocylindrales bacterium]|nr:carbonic anhydrase [Candidatus Limnocylindrales bacterium]